MDELIILSSYYISGTVLRYGDTKNGENNLCYEGACTQTREDNMQTGLTGDNLRINFFPKFLPCLHQLQH